MSNSMILKISRDKGIECKNNERDLAIESHYEVMEKHGAREISKDKQA